MTLDPSKRLTAIEALGTSYFDGLREPEIDRLIQQHAQAKSQQMAQLETVSSALNQYMNPPLTHKDRRGESSKSRASVRSNPHGTAEAMGGNSNIN